jgi:hypothetical protein
MTERKYPTNAKELFAAGEVGKWQKISYKTKGEPDWLKQYPKPEYPKFETREDGTVYTPGDPYFQYMLQVYPRSH